MRLPTSKLRRCRPPPPPQPLQHFVCHYISSSTSHSSCSLFSRPIHYPHHHKGHGSFNTGWSSELRSLSPRDFVSFARRFSIEPKLSELDDPIPSVQTIISMLDSYHDVTGFPRTSTISATPVRTKFQRPDCPFREGKEGPFCVLVLLIVYCSGHSRILTAPDNKIPPAITRQHPSVQVLEKYMVYM